MAIQINLNQIQLAMLDRRTSVVARRLDISPAALRMKLRGESEFRVRELNALSVALEIPITRFVSIQ
ncbi:MAG: hypothetical protein UV58_C0026G0010 [Candidatus Wolfebacteria bacterium GW2011_GWC1_43_10]|uniref:HTH cro/C1-type domain-containing protein n=1 Tax=Candidatus Wolfebacteria bacterium GW2011_GWC1_43_10 TaxID=1619011 RepID=A0A0G1C6A6_9BACT|nr:MAG: hypothetical protein UV58_C0026G0010 [Candidatus Wolfebacteria bacterium GW2011_GWC1_43_10]